MNETFRYQSLGVWCTRLGGLFWICLAALLVAILWYNFVTGSPARKGTVELLVLSATMILAALFGTVMLNLFPDVATAERGICVRYFLLVWLFVPWEKIIGVRLSLASVRGGTHLVQVKRLPFVYTLISLFHRGSLRPGFLVSSALEGHEELLRSIREHAARRDTAHDNTKS